ncbi:HAD family hydrolase [Metabacillus litoralis]|uniref:HAD family hydrolase n=1 Tax=Metabacillus litoralis TaxID=152268 RepID=UPI000EF61516|nr:HAD family hydrolase [Metabacillus litoralis]
MDTIIFDVDDTLYDQLKPFKNAFTSNFKHLTDISIEKLYISSRKHSERLFDKSEAGTVSLLELHTYRIMAACKEFEIEINENEAITFQRTYEEEQKKITLYPEIERLLELLSHKGKQLGILTNGPHQHQLMKINQLGLTRWIPEEHIFISGAIGSAKPALLAFETVEKKLLLNKNHTVYIGDSFDNDVIGAKKAGWYSIWMNHRKKDIPLSSIQPDKIIHTPKELLDLMVATHNIRS